MTNHESTDGWILCAITLAGEPATLTGVLWTADHLNCTLPLLHEINGALLRLGRLGLVRRTGDGLSVSPVVRRFHAQCVHEPARIVHQRFDDFLRDFVPDGPVEEFENQPFTEAEVAGAVKQHAKEHSAELKRLMGDKRRG